MHTLHNTLDHKASRLVLSLVLAYVVYLLVLLISIGVYPLSDPSLAFTQGDCDQGLTWYRDPVTMAHKLDCSLAHIDR